MKKRENLFRIGYSIAWMITTLGWCFYFGIINGLPVQLMPIVLVISIISSFFFMSISAFILYILILGSHLSKKGLNRRLARVKRKLKNDLKRIKRHSTKLYTLKEYDELLYKKKPEKSSHDIVLGVDLAKYFHNNTRKPGDRYGE